MTKSDEVATKSDTAVAIKLADALRPIERDEGYDRTYIPLPGGWEIQTKGKGSTFRLCDPSGHRLAIPEQPYLFDTLERMARDIHALAANPAPDWLEVVDAVRDVMHEVFKYADIAAPLRGPPMTQDESLPVRIAASAQDRIIRNMLYALATPRPAPAADHADYVLVPTEAMIEVGNDGAAPYMVDAKTLWSQMLAAAPQHVPCPCGQSTCKESWEPGCGLGNSREHAQPAPAPVRVDVTDAMVRRFLNWRLPGHIKPDGVYPVRDAPYPMTGTNLLDYDAAKAMLEWVLTDMSPQAQLKRVLDGAFAPDDPPPPAPAADGARELPLYDDRFWQNGIAGDANIVTFNGEDIVGVARIHDDGLRAHVIRKQNESMRAAIAALRQPVPDAVGLEQFRRPVTYWARMAAHCGENELHKEAERLLALIA